MTSSARPQVIVVSNTAFSIVKYRWYLITRLIDMGYHVVVVAALDQHAAQIAGDHITFMPWKLQRSGTNPLSELKSLWQLGCIIKPYKPAFILSFTIKANSYATLTARVLRIPIIAVVTGLGYSFSNRTLKAFLGRSTLLLSLWLADRILVQNSDDTAYIRSLGRALAAKTTMIYGSGLDITHYQSQQRPPDSNHPVFTMMSRLLHEKGVGEYIAATRLIKAKYPHVRFHLVAPPDPDNPAAYDIKEIEKACESGLLTYSAWEDDVRSTMDACTCFIHPTYYKEGIPRFLIEAAAMSRPIIATDVAGCTDIVTDGVNGLLCKPKDSHSLATAMEQFLRMPPAAQQEMGRQGRLKVLQHFSNERVFETYAAAITSVLAPDNHSCAQD